MGDLIRIVDRIDATPAVLFDLNDENPCGVTGFSAPPPLLVRANVQTMLRDGSTDAGSVFGDRSIEVDLDLYASSQDASAAVLQNLARLLSDPRGQWLMYQPTGASAPVFFRTKRADISSIEDVLSSDALRELELSIPAEPFAYGLPVTGTGSVKNNPHFLQAPNEMGFTVSDVQGDVPTPLRLQLPVVAGRSAQSVVTALSRSEVPAMTSKVYMDCGSPGVTAPGWSQTHINDSSWINGSKFRLIHTSGNDPQPIGPGRVETLYGDYRVLLRAMPGAALTVEVVSGNIGGSSAQVLATKDLPPTSSPIWFDIGVVRLPSGAPILDGRGLSDVPMDSAIMLQVRSPSAGTSYFDGVMLLPAGIDDATRGSYAHVTLDNSTSVAGDAYIDTIHDRTYMLVSGALIINPTTTTFDGGLPYVTPGADNHVWFVKNVYSPTYPSVEDQITDVTDLQWLYYPLYVYGRPAAS